MGHIHNMQDCEIFKRQTTQQKCNLKMWKVTRIFSWASILWLGQSTWQTQFKGRRAQCDSEFESFPPQPGSEAEAAWWTGGLEESCWPQGKQGAWHRRKARAEAAKDEIVSSSTSPWPTHLLHRDPPLKSPFSCELTRGLSQRQG